MKKGKGGIKGKRNHGKGKARVDFKTTYIERAKGKSYDRLHYPAGDPRFEKKKESAANWENAFNNPEQHIDTRPKADVHCINEARKARGQPEITTAVYIPDRKKTEHIVNNEAHVYARWAERSSKSRDTVELAYYSKLDTKRKKAEEYSGIEFHKNKAETTTPPKRGGAYAFAKGRGVGSGLAPSGLPISEFLEGGKYPPKKREVTQCNPVKPASVMSAAEMETAARNDPSFSPQVPDIKWFINNVPPDSWPSIIREYTYLADGQWRVNKSKLFSAKGMSLNNENESLERTLAKTQQELAELQEAYDEAQLEHYRVKDELITKNEEQTNTIGMLYQELHELNSVVKLSELHSVTSGNASHKSSPRSVSELATLFNVHKSQWNDDPLNAFCRVYDVPDKQRVELRNHFNLQCAQRLAVSEYRNFYRRLAERNKTQHVMFRKAVRIKAEIRALQRVGNRASYGAWLQKHAPSMEYVTQCNKRSLINTLRYERGVYSRWATSNRDHVSNKAINNRVRLAELREEQRVQDLMSTKTYKILKTAKDILNYDCNPLSRKADERKRKHSETMKKKSLKDKEVKASRIKELREKQDEERRIKDAAREAYRIAH